MQAQKEVRSGVKPPGMGKILLEVLSSVTISSGERSELNFLKWFIIDSLCVIYLSLIGEYGSCWSNSSSMDRKGKCIYKLFSIY